MKADHSRADRLLLLVLILAGLALVAVSLGTDRLGLALQPAIQQLVLLAGVALIGSGLWFGRTNHVDQRWVWPLVLASLLVVGTGVRFVEASYDRYDFDEYHLMMGVDESLADYGDDMVGSESLQFVVHYWLTYRVLGGSLWAYRALPLLAGVALLFVTWLGLRRFWPGQEFLYLGVLGLLILNDNALFLTRYAMFAYGATFLTAAGLFFLFLRLAEGPLATRTWLWIGAVLPLVAFFANDFLVIPLATGGLSVLALRWARSPGARGLRRLWSWTWEMKPLLIFPLVFAVRQVVFPYTLWGPSLRADQVDLYFPTSDYAQTARGALAFLLDRTYTFFVEVLAPARLAEMPGPTALFVAGCVLLAGIGLVAMVRRRDARLAFTALFLFTTVASMALASLLGLYPYGIVRYAPSAFLPSAILIAAGGAAVYAWLVGRMGLARSRRAILTALAVVVLAGGALLAQARLAHIEQIRRDDARVLAWLRSEPADVVLADAYIATVLYTQAPEVYDQLGNMGWGAYYGEGHDPVPQKILDELEGAGTPAPAESVAVVLYPHQVGRTDDLLGFARRHPQYHNLLAPDYALGATMESFHIEGQLYLRTAEEAQGD